MTELKIFANYGCLSAEKKTIYTYGAPEGTAVTSDELTVSIPDGWTLYDTNFGDQAVTAPWGQNYGINEVLDTKDDRPVFMALDPDCRWHTEALEVIG